jgi:hypothetical protein
MTHNQEAQQMTWQEATSGMNADRRGKKIELLATELGKLVDTRKLGDELEIALSTGEALHLPVISAQDQGEGAEEMLVEAIRRVRD